MKPCEGMSQVAEMVLGMDYDYPTVDAYGCGAEDQSRRHGTLHRVIAATTVNQ